MLHVKLIVKYESNIFILAEQYMEVMLNSSYGGQPHSSKTFFSSFLTKLFDKNKFMKVN